MSIFSEDNYPFAFLLGITCLLCAFLFHFCPSLIDCENSYIIFFPPNLFLAFNFVVVQLLSSIQFFVTPWAAALQACLFFNFHWVSDAIQLSHPLSPPSLPAFNLSQHQGLFQWVSSYIMWPKYSCFFLPLGLTGLISLLSKGLWRGFCSITIQKHQFFVIQHSLWSNSPILTWRLEKP